MARINPIFGAVPDHINKRLAFVLMPFREDLTRIYTSIVKPVVKGKDLDCQRADDYKTIRTIIQDIWQAICESRLVIADMTDLNPNVMYELGIAHAVGKDTIIIHQRKGHVQFPFDLAHIRRIEYEDTADGGKKLELELGETLNSVLSQEPLTEPIMEVVSETPEPIIKTILVESTQTQDDIKLTLHSVDLKDDVTIAHLSVENNSPKETTFWDSHCHVVQGRRQFRAVKSSINLLIPPGIEEKGYVYFDPVDAQGRIEFNFVMGYDLKFIFRIEIVPD